MSLIDIIYAGTKEIMKWEVHPGLSLLVDDQRKDPEPAKIGKLYMSEGGKLGEHWTTE